MRQAKYSKNQLQRYPVYLKYLIGLREEGAVYVSSTRIGQALGYSEEQVRKDLQAVSEEGGRPRKGRKVESLIETLEAFLGYREADSAILIGAGSLGSALLRYPSFRDMGLDIKAAFDVDPRKIGLRVGDVPVYPMKDLERLARGLDARIAIVCTPAFAAQSSADMAVRAGCRGIWSFAPVHLVLPKGVVLEEVNLASSLAVLAHRLDSDAMRS